METDTQRNFKKQMKQLEKQKDYKNKFEKSVKSKKNIEKLCQKKRKK
jgi:hypothetical protein